MSMALAFSVGLLCGVRIGAQLMAFVHGARRVPR